MVTDGRLKLLLRDTTHAIMSTDPSIYQLHIKVTYTHTYKLRPSFHILSTFEVNKTTVFGFISCPVQNAIGFWHLT